jgi:GNAT superfamily N-acetyltransferase
MAELRAARESDIPRLMEIRAAVRENRLVSVTIGPDDYRPYIEDARCWVAEADGAVQAFAALDAATATIWALFVDPAYEGRGLASALLARLIAEARARGLHALTLETGAGTRAEAFYLRHGFNEAARDGGTLHMTLALG